jgi:hypothetical protein
MSKNKRGNETFGSIPGITGKSLEEIEEIIKERDKKIIENLNQPVDLEWLKKTGRIVDE